MGCHIIVNLLKKVLESGKKVLPLEISQTQTKCIELDGDQTSSKSVEMMRKAMK